MTATLARRVEIPHLALSSAATATNVRHLRRTLRDWLGSALADDPDSADDLVLAASEALENVVDHAFTDVAVAGTMRIRATDHDDRVTIVISDDGHWRRPGAPGFRGRGIELMDRLADVSRVVPTTGGTSVTLVHRRPA